MVDSETLLETARSFDLNQALYATSEDPARKEVRTGALLRYIQQVYQVDFGAARDLLNVLVQIGSLRISSFTTVRFML